MAFKKFYPKKKAVPKKRVYRKKTVAKASIKTMIKKALDKRIENKTVCLTDQLFDVYSAGGITITTSTVANLNPIITQSVGESGRVGNTVKLKNLFMRAYMSLAGSISSTQTPQIPGQFNVRVFIGRLKNTIAAPQTAELNTLLRTGTLVSPFDSSNALSLVRSVNTELFTIFYDKIHKIGSQHNGTGTVTTGIGNNDYKLSKFLKISLTKAFKKTLQFQDTSINTPTNCGLYMWAGCVDSLGSNYTTLSPVVNIAYDLEYSYEDA